MSLKESEENSETNDNDNSECLYNEAEFIQAALEDCAVSLNSVLRLEI